MIDTKLCVDANQNEDGTMPALLLPTTHGNEHSSNPPAGDPRGTHRKKKEIAVHPRYMYCDLCRVPVALAGYRGTVETQIWIRSFSWYNFIVQMTKRTSTCVML